MSATLDYRRTVPAQTGPVVAPMSTPIGCTHGAQTSEFRFAHSQARQPD
jgi:hypothetical protein